MKTKENRKNRGITLIALVITIIVLLILAGITIGAITGDNGIIQNALSAKEQTEIANEREIVEKATVQAMGKNKRGNLVRDELQEELDKLTGEGETIVTTDTEESGYFVKFVASGRIYKVSIDGDVKYLGKEDELITQADIIADPESNTTPELIQQVDLTVKTPIEIEGAEYSLVYAWNQDKENAPEDEKFLEANLIGEGRIRTTTVYSSDTVGGDYYLWVRIVVGETEKEACFGPYAIKDHTTLVVTSEETESTSGFLGNSEVQRGKIQNIDITTTLEGHSVEDENTWDVSQSKNGMYLAWYEVNENGYYDVTIAGEGGVVANSDSSSLFRNIGIGITDTKIEVSITGLEYLDTGLVTNMVSMFDNCKTSSLELSNFDTSNVTNMGGMFAYCNNLMTLNINSFDTSKVINMGNMFESCSVINLDLSHFNTSNVTNMRRMFLDCSNLATLNISNFDTSNVTSMWGMFYSCSKLTNLDVSSFNTSNVTDMFRMFYRNESLEKLDVSNFNTNKVTNMLGMFTSCSKLTELDLSSFDTSNVTNMNMMFYDCRSLTTLNVSSFNTSKVTDMGQLFSGCTSLVNFDISKFDTSNVTNMSMMFYACTFSEINLDNLDTSKVTNMSNMFARNSNLIKLNLTKFDTNEVTTMQEMFSQCNNLEEVDLSNFNTSKVNNMNSMFWLCDKLLKVNIKNFDMTNVDDYESMFVIRNPNSNLKIIANSTTGDWIRKNFPDYAYAISEE